MQEEWYRWEPIQGLTKKYYIESISDSMDGFIIILSDAKDEKLKASVNFYDHVDSYRFVDESFRLDVIQFLETHYGTPFYGEWTLFKISNSSYIEWLSKSSYGISDSMDFIHFCFLSVDSIVDVVTTYEPKVTFL